MITALCIIVGMGVFGVVAYVASTTSLISLIRVPVSKRRFHRALGPMTPLVESDDLSRSYRAAADTIDSVNDAVRLLTAYLAEQAKGDQETERPRLNLASNPRLHKILRGEVDL